MVAPECGPVNSLRFRALPRLLRRILRSQPAHLFLPQPLNHLPASAAPPKFPPVTVPYVRQTSQPASDAAFSLGSCAGNSVASAAEIIRSSRYGGEAERSSPNLPILLRIPSYLPNIPARVMTDPPGGNATRSIMPPAPIMVQRRRNWPRVLGYMMLVAISLVPTAIINRRTLLPYVRDARCWISAIRESFTSSTTSGAPRAKKVKARRTVKPAEPLPAPVVRLDAYIVPIDGGAQR